MISAPIILSNVAGPEAEFARESAADVSAATGWDTVDVSSPEWLNRIGKPSYVFLATHGGYAESGELQNHLSSEGFMFSHSSASACSILSNKSRTKDLYRSLEIPTPSCFFRGDRMFADYESCQFVRKPVTGGGKNDVTLVSQADLDSEFLYEDYVSGTAEISVYVLGASKLVLPPLVRRRSEIIGLLEFCSTPVAPALLERCAIMALAVHAHVYARGITKTDFVVDESGRPFAVDTDSHPALGRSRGAASQASVLGIEYLDLVKRIVDDV